MSWRARPGALARRVAALTVGLLLILMASDGPTFINPGPLTFQHSQIQDCVGCHAAFDKGPTSWVHAAFAENTIISDSKRCIACHDQGNNNLRAHSLPPAQIKALGSTVNPMSSGSWAMIAASASIALGQSHKNNDTKLGCMTCHQEHQGSAANLSAMSGTQCQVCHSFQFSSLSDGHPEFDSYPFERRTRISFDHASHIGKHFRDKAVQDSAPKECKNCHTPAAGGRQMLAVGFETGCAACHGGQVQGVGRATAKGLSVFNVPGLDMVTLEKRGVDIGEWPEDAEEELTPFMDFLLAGDSGYPAIKKTLAELDLLDLAAASEAQITAAQDLAWRVKELLFDLATLGVPALKARLEKSLGRPLAPPEFANLAGLLPVDTVRSAQAHWFVNLYRDVMRHRTGPPSAAGNDAGDKKNEDLLVGDKEDKGGGDLLADDKDAKGGGDLLADDKENNTGDKKDDVKEPLNKPETLASGEDWSQAGGWYRDDFVLRYRPIGHGDRFVKAWLDVTGNGGDEPGKSAGWKIFNKLGDSKSPGLCVKCHSVDAGTDGSALTVNWRARRPVVGKRPFSIFSHTAHFSLLDEKGCLSCHTPDAKAAYSESYKDRNPMTFASNFKPIKRANCANCHTAKEAGDNCLICHNYHIGTFPPAIASTPKMMSSMSNQPR